MAKSHTRTIPIVRRLVVAALVGAQALVGLPIAARTESAPVVPGLRGKPLPEPRVTVNRRVPRVTPAPLEPSFSGRPSALEITRARVFDEPVVPVGVADDAAENRLLADALLTLHRNGRDAWRSTVGAFLQSHASSPWRPSLLVNVAQLQSGAHEYSAALGSLDEAWRLTKDRTDAAGRSVANLAMANWLTIAASFGQVQEVRARLALLTGRDLSGVAAMRIARARETVDLIEAKPDLAIYCGPEAILALLEGRDATGFEAPKVLSSYRGGPQGMTLEELRVLAGRAGVRLTLATYSGASDIPVPSIVHWTIGHYSTIVERRGDEYRVVDRARKLSYWMSRAAIVAESSGHFLVAGKKLTAGWKATSASDAKTFVGAGPLCPDGSGPPAPPTDYGDDPNTPDDPDQDGGNDGPTDDADSGPPTTCSGMPTYTFQSVTASLLIRDSPVGYTAPLGPAVPFMASYHQRDSVQPQTFSFSNLGPKWSLNWIRFVKEEPTDALGVTPPHVYVFLPPGGREVYVNPDGAGVFPAHWHSRAVLALVSSSPVRYERRLPDGSVEIYEQSDGAPAGQRRIFLTSLIDRHGQTLTLTWDGQSRLVAVTDALGQVSTLTYEMGSDIRKVTRITDPFGRSAQFGYNAAGQLESIVDVLGLQSRFAYGQDDFVTTLTTPYGATSFRTETPALNSMYGTRFIEATDPLGGTEHLEWQYETPSLSASVASGDVPSGFSAWNDRLNLRNTFYWTKRAWAAGPNDLSKAVIKHWLEQAEWDGWQIYATPTPHSIKRPLEARVWYSYPGQVSGYEWVAGWLPKPSRIGRKLDDGTSQVYQGEFNDLGWFETSTDPLGRRTTHAYDSTGIDLLSVRQTTGVMNDLIATFSDFASPHEPQTVTDAAGQSVALTYNSAGQVLSVTNALSETTSLAYNTDGYVTHMTTAGATTALTYDAYGRVRTVTGPDGYGVTFDYDALDRRVRTTFPDATYEETTYDRLDVASRRDRLGRITRYYHDNLRHLVGVRDALGRSIRLERCSCGALNAFVDANGNQTRWERDLQGRVTREVRADSSDVEYAYESATGRLHSLTDPKGQVQTFEYFLDGALKQLTYTNATTSTPSVSWTYDSAYGRLASMTDGIGTTVYDYHPVGELGAGQLSAVNGPLSSDTINVSYDEIGRRSSRVLNGVTDTWSYDGLSRVTSLTDPIGTFTWDYDGDSQRVSQLTYPNDQASTYTYFNNAGDRRLQAIQHKDGSLATLSAFAYAYDVRGRITTWIQQYGTTSRAYDFGYDAADQLTSAVYRTTESTPTILGRAWYRYDAAGNRTYTQSDNAPRAWSYNGMNRLTSFGGAALMQFAGTVSEPASVMVQGASAAMTGGTSFAATASVVDGTNVVSVQATDASGNVRSQSYSVDVTDSTGTFSYDANGNLTTQGARTYEWDAENRLLTVRDGGTVTASFSYDGWGRRVSKSAAGVTHMYVYDGDDVVEDRASGTTLRTIHGLNVDQPLATVNAAGDATYYLTDHLGSVIQTTDDNGAITLTRRYDPYGVPLEGAGASGYAFTGREWDAETGLYYYRARYYDPTLGRFISADPIGPASGPSSLYAYVSNSPLAWRDPSGTFIWPAVLAAAATLTLPEAVVAATLLTVTVLVVRQVVKPLLTKITKDLEDYDGFIKPPKKVDKSQYPEQTAEEQHESIASQKAKLDKWGETGKIDSIEKSKQKANRQGSKNTKDPCDE